MTAPYSMHVGYEHVALLHHGADDLGERLAPEVTGALSNGEAVLVSLERTHWEALADRLGPSADEVTYLEAGSRYATPGGAMATVHRFATTALAAGAPTAWSIGSIPFDGANDDARWVRYEAAVDRVLGGLPCRLVCAYDANRVAEHLLASACRSHAAIDAHGHRRPSPVFSPDAPIPPSILAPPREQMAIDAVVDSPVLVRRLLSTAFGTTVDAERLADVHVVASELATNGLRHGHPPVWFRAWQDAGQIVIEVSDHGTGLTDPFPDLRPPKSTQQYGGYGLWIVGQLSDRFDLFQGDGVTVIRAAIRC